MSEQDPNVVSVSNSDARMNAAMAEARSTVDSFVEALKDPRPGASGFAVKIPLTHGSTTEHIWANRIRYDGELFHGVVNSQPASVTGVKLGDQITARPDGISDWMYLQGRTLVGGYTIRAFRDGLSALEREDFDRGAPFIVRAETRVRSAVKAPAELVGTWDLISTDSGQGPVSRPGIRMVITEDSMAMVAADGTTKPMGTVAEIHPKSTPRGISLRGRGDIGLGIYEVNDDELKLIICDPGLPRPTEFKGERKGILFRLKRRQ